jgi:ketosteroid isomerase-like protein
MKVMPQNTSSESTRQVVHRYYEAWAGQDREEVRSTLSDDLVFRSPQDAFSSADEFPNSCWKYSKGLSGVDFLKEVYMEDQAFVVLDWHSEDGSHFADAEYARVKNAKICEILVVNNDPSFTELIG